MAFQMAMISGQLFFTSQDLEIGENPEIEMLRYETLFNSGCSV
jgi:hypothetical protein